MRQPRNWILFVLVVFIWASGWSIMKVALSYVGPLNLALQRFALSALALSPLLIYLRNRIPRDKGTVLKLLFLGMVNASAIIPMYWGVVYETSGIGAVLTYTHPIFVFCLSVLFLRTEAKRGRILGAVVGFSGVIVLSIGGASSVRMLAGTGDILLILGAFLWAVTLVYYKRSLSHVDAALTSVIQQGLSAVFVAPLALVVEGFSFPLTRPYLMMIVYLSIFASGIAICLWLYLVREEDITALSLSSFLIPMVAVFLGWLLLAEDVQPRSILGMGLILTGLYLTNRPGSS
ncbi:DMT family transporter [[Eubacterium] cellulosolvens]